jgi:hypothetical protein
MATSKDLLNGFEKEAVVVKAVVLYLGSEIRENAEGQYSHQFVLMPSKRDPRGGVVSVKHSKKLALETNGVYYLEAEASSERPDNHYGVSIYWLRNPKALKLVSSFKEMERN